MAVNDAVRRVFQGAKDASLDQVMRTAIIRRQKGTCFYCETALGHSVVFDHLIPRSEGGRHGPSNRVAACSQCDMRKGARLPSQAELDRFERSSRGDDAMKFDAVELRAGKGEKRVQMRLLIRCCGEDISMDPSDGSWEGTCPHCGLQFTAPVAPLSAYAPLRRAEASKPR